MQVASKQRIRLIRISTVMVLIAAGCPKPAPGRGDGDTDSVHTVVDECEGVVPHCPPGMEVRWENSADFQSFEIIGKVGGVGVVPIAGVLAGLAGAGGGKVNVGLENTSGDCTYMCVPPPCFDEDKTACFSYTCFVCATDDSASLAICQSCTDQGEVMPGLDTGDGV